MNSFGWFFAHRRKMDWTSWRSLVIVVPALFGVLVVAPQAARETKAAATQQSSEGVVTGYERSDHNQCSYTFSVRGRQYSGKRSAATTDVTVGDHVLVYYDSQQPTMNALEDFSVMGQRDKSFVYILLFVIGAFVAFILYSKATAAKSVDRSANA